MEEGGEEVTKVVLEKAPQRLMMKSIIRIEYLSDNTHALPKLARYYKTEWPQIYADVTEQELIAEFKSKANKTLMPIAIVALFDEEVVGALTISEHVVKTNNRSSIWLSGFYVDPEFRGKGIGKRLLKTAAKITKLNGFDEIFAGTDSVKTMLLRYGWKEIAIVPFQDQLLSILKIVL